MGSNDDATITRQQNAAELTSIEDSFPDATELFELYDIQFFEGILRDRCKLEWSNKMTSCAGICYYKKHPPTTAITKASHTPGGVEKLMSEYPQCIIRLSEPLLKYRSVKEMKETIAHEMIHAYCFVFNLEKSRDGHGDVFKKFMTTINEATGLNITVYHSFHDEVQHYKTHVWRCQGPCRNRPPYFGYVRRAQNRAPGPSSYWWAKHQSECGGTYLKESSPDPQPAPTVTGPKQETLESLLSNLCSESNESSRERKRRRLENSSEPICISPQSTSSSSAGRRVHIGMGEKLEERRRRKAAHRTPVDATMLSGCENTIDLAMDDYVVSINGSSDEEEAQTTANKRLADRLAAEPTEIQKIPVRDTPQARAALLRLYGIGGGARAAET